jgi:protein-S-isoprenylcysteine O-methyltransferase Ste14
MCVGSILLFIGMRLVVAATWAWIFSALGMVGIIVRIRKEEAFLATELAGYEEYTENTWRLLPYVY